MHVVSSHEHSIFLELAIATLEQRGIAKENIMAIPMKKKEQQMALFDTIHQADGISNLDGAAVLGTIMMVLGAIYGFIWVWGPIIWGLIGLFVGSIVGFIIKILLNKKHRKMRELDKSTEVFLLVNCLQNQAEWVERVLWEHNALGVAKLDMETRNRE